MEKMHCTGIAEVMGSNPFKPEFFQGFFFHNSLVAQIPARSFHLINLEIKFRLFKYCTVPLHSLTLAASTAFCGSLILGNAYNEPVTPSREFNTDVVIFAFLRYASRTAIFSCEEYISFLTTDYHHPSALISKKRNHS